MSDPEQDWFDYIFLGVFVILIIWFGLAFWRIE